MLACHHGEGLDTPGASIAETMGNDGVVMSTTPPPGWYSNPSGAPGQRYFDGYDWTLHHRATPPSAGPPAGTIPDPAVLAPRYATAPLPADPVIAAMPYAAVPRLAYPPVPPPTVVVTGPNHALHAVLTLLTFWACGGWAWIWLIVALSNRRQVRIVLPPPPR